jgi:hypothetical protein
VRSPKSSREFVIVILIVGENELVFSITADEWRIPFAETSPAVALTPPLVPPFHCQHLLSSADRVLGS